jgi:hypothetical protein
MDTSLPILVVDDSQTVRLAVSKQLQSWVLQMLILLKMGIQPSAVCGRGGTGWYCRIGKWPQWGAKNF